MTDALKMLMKNCNTCLYVELGESEHKPFLSCSFGSFSVDNKVTPSVPRTDGVTSLPTIPPFLPPATALLPMPPPRHVRPLFIADSQPKQPLPVAQLPHEVAPPCQNGLVPVLHPSRDKPWTWGMDQYQAILARWRSFVWQLRHWQWLVWKRFCYEVRRLMVR